MTGQWTCTAQNYHSENWLLCIRYTQFRLLMHWFPFISGYWDITTDVKMDDRALGIARATKNSTINLQHLCSLSVYVPIHG